jgi:hypothetical protein
VMDMTSRFPFLMLLVLASSVLSMPERASAQVGNRTGQPASFGQQPGGTPLFANPMLNPYLNPYASQFAGNNNDFLLYLYAANQANGGIGTGVISGTRPAPGRPAGSLPPGQNPGLLQRGAGQPSPFRNTSNRPLRPGEYPAATMPRSASRPGSAAGNYFYRGMQSNDGAGRYFDRMLPRPVDNRR